MYKSFSMDSMWGCYCSIECEDFGGEKMTSQGIGFSQWLLLIITKIGIKRTGKHHLH